MAQPGGKKNPNKPNKCSICVLAEEKETKNMHGELSHTMHTLNYNPTHHIQPKTSRVVSVLKNRRFSCVWRMFSEHYRHIKDLVDVKNVSFFILIPDGIHMKQVRESASVRVCFPDVSHQVSGF